MKKKPQANPGPLTRFLLRRVVRSDQPADSPDNRTRIGMLEGWISTFISLLLCVVKGWLGLVSGSVSLLADATNNLTDVGSSLVVALGFQWSRKPCDEEHPFGHGRIEAVVTLVLSFALLAVGVEVARSGIGRLLDPREIQAASWLLVVVGVTVVVKLWLAFFAHRLARMTRSHVLEADAWNHIFDVFSTLLVIGALFCSRLGWGVVDGWAALLVAVFILITGYKYGREAIDILLGKRADPEDLEAVYGLVDAIDGVCGVHAIVVHQYGDVKMVSLHVEVDASRSLVEAHRISEAAECAVEEHLQWRAVVHVDPVDRSHPLFDELHGAVKTFVRATAETVDFHDLRVEGDVLPFRVSLGLVVGPEICGSRVDALYDLFAQMMRERFGRRVEVLELGVESSVGSAPVKRRTVLL